MILVQVAGWVLVRALGALALGVALLGGGSGCAGRSPNAPPGVSATATASQAADAQAGVAVPFSLCRSFGTAGTPCYPTNVDIGSRVISPCRDRQRGHCELSGPRHTMACLLAPVPDGKPCGEAAVCKDGSCLPQQYLPGKDRGVSLVGRTR